MDWILPPLSWEHLVRLSSSPLLKKQSVPSSLCRRTCSSSFIHPPPSIGFLAFFSFCHGAPSASMTRPWLWVEEGNICNSGELRKGKSQPSCLCVCCQLGVTFIICLGAFFFFVCFVWRAAGSASLRICALWNPLPGSCWMPRLLQWHQQHFFLKYSPSLLSSSEPHGTLNWSYCVGRGWGWVEETVNSS